MDNDIKQVRDDHTCFVCGQENPIGFKLHFDLDKEKNEASSNVIIAKEYNGFKGITHGGIVSALLDEVSFYAALTLDLITVTAKLTVNFKNPCPTEKKLLLKGKVTKNRKKLIETHATVCLEDGTILAEADGVFFVRGKYINGEIIR